MCDKPLLVSYLYDEVDSSEKQTIEDHLATCPDCRAEVSELRATRTQLAQWAPPERALGLQLDTASVGPVAVPVRRWKISPVWGMAAAAVLVLAMAAAIANLELRYDSQGFTVRTGWGATVPPATAPPQRDAVLVPVDTAALKAQIETLGRRVSELESASRQSPVVAVRDAGPRVSEADVTRQLRKLIADSEVRQQRELALRIGQVLRDVEVGRRADLARIQQGITHLQGLTDTMFLRQRQTEDQFLRVVQQK